MSFFVEKLGPAKITSRKQDKSVAAADLLQHQATPGAPQATRAPQPAPAPQKPTPTPPRAQAERAAPAPKAVDRSPPPQDDPPKKKKGWFG